MNESPAFGESCSPDSGCRHGYECVESVCTAAPADPVPCEAMSGEPCPGQCTGGLYGDVWEDGYCTSPPVYTRKSGEDCNGYQRCGSGLRCIGGTCYELKREGQGCLDEYAGEVSNCEPGLFCNYGATCEASNEGPRLQLMCSE